MNVLPAVVAPNEPPIIKRSKLKEIEDLLADHVRNGEPREPTPDECCGNGCSPCVWDTYYDRSGKYDDRKGELESMIIEI